MAADGEQAIERFSAENPDIVLLDIMMPKLDGWQVCRDIRKKSNCPIIMITAKVRPLTRFWVWNWVRTIM